MRAADAHVKVVEAGDPAKQRADFGDAQRRECVGVLRLDRRKLCDRVGKRFVRAELLRKADRLVGTLGARFAVNDCDVRRQVVAAGFNRDLVLTVGVKRP